MKITENAYKKSEMINAFLDDFGKREDNAFQIVIFELARYQTPEQLEDVIGICRANMEVN